MSEFNEFNQIPVSCGMDVHKKSITVCLISTIGNETKKEFKTFTTMTRDIETLSKWLVDSNCTRVVMESTGQYWKPVFNILEELDLKVLLANARHVKNLPGRKTDMSDAEWLAILNRNGLIKGSFIPPREIRELRDLCRLRRKTVEDRTRIKNRISKLVEDGNIKLGSVATDLFGVSGLNMLTKLAEGDSAPKDIANLAKGKLKKKIKKLNEAAYGRMFDHHRQILKHLLKQYKMVDSLVDDLDKMIKEKSKPFTKEIKLLETIPGVNFTAAISIIAETGVDMSVFTTYKHISSWAGVCPGNNESAGKNYSGKAPKGNLYLKSILCQAAWSAVRSKNTYLSNKYWSLKSRRGAKKAIMAIAHKILIAVFHMLKNMEPYRELGSDYLDKIKGKRAVSSMAQRLKKLGYAVIPQKEKPAINSLNSP